MRLGRERDLRQPRDYLSVWQDDRPLVALTRTCHPFTAGGLDPARVRREARQHVRALCRNFIEIHVATPLEECERRDVKGLCARARRGEVTHFTGIDDPYEPPLAAELVLDTTGMTVPHAVAAIMAVWEEASGMAASLATGARSC